MLKSRKLHKVNFCIVCKLCLLITGRLFIIFLNAALHWNMKWSFGLCENKDVLNNKTDGPGLLTEALCMATRDANCTEFLLTL